MKIQPLKIIVEIEEACADKSAKTHAGGNPVSSGKRTRGRDAGKIRCR